VYHPTPMNFGVWIPNCERVPASSHAGRVLAGESAALVKQIGELASCGVEHLVLEFLAADGRELEEQLTTFAERVRPQLA
jgi:hypothetical protein